jgi:hypothetical protein
MSYGFYLMGRLGGHKILSTLNFIFLFKNFSLWEVDRTVVDYLLQQAIKKPLEYKSKRETEWIHF